MVSPLDGFGFDGGWQDDHWFYNFKYPVLDFFSPPKSCRYNTKRFYCMIRCACIKTQITVF